MSRQIFGVCEKIALNCLQQEHLAACLDLFGVLSIDGFESVFIDLSGQAFKGLDPILESQDPAAITARQGQEMQRANHRNAILIDLGQILHDGIRGGGVQTGYRLIGKDDPGFLHQGPGDSHPLLLASGELLHLLVGKILEPHAL